jgi:hypothetical protein
MKCEQFFPITSVLWLNGFVEPVPRNGVVIVTATYPCQQKYRRKDAYSILCESTLPHHFGPEPPCRIHGDTENAEGETADGR